MPSKTHQILQSATWWKGKVTVVEMEKVEVVVKGRVEVPVKETTIFPSEDKLMPYNPFDFYFPDLRTKQQRAISLYHRFVRVDPLNINEVQAFCEKFGVLGNPQKTWEQWNATAISENFGDTGPSHDSLSNRMATKSRTPPHPSLCTPMLLHEFQLERSAMEMALQDIQKIDQHKTPKIAKQEAREILTDRLAGELTKIGQRPLWDQKTRGWILQYDSLSLVAIMYQMLLSDLLGPGKNVRCEKCGKLFLAEHPRTQYCNDTCRNTLKKTRQREKQKRMLKR